MLDDVPLFFIDRRQWVLVSPTVLLDDLPYR